YHPGGGSAPAPPPPPPPLLCPPPPPPPPRRRRARSPVPRGRARLASSADTRRASDDFTSATMPSASGRVTPMWRGSTSIWMIRCVDGSPQYLSYGRSRLPSRDPATSTTSASRLARSPPAPRP